MSNGLLSQDAQLDISFNLSGSFAFVASSKTITRSTGSFLTDGILVGQQIETNKAGNLGVFTVVSVTATAITVLESVADAAASTVLLTVFQEVGELVNSDGPDAKRDEIEMTHLKSKGKEFKLGLADGGSISGEGNFVVEDPGQMIMRAAKGEKISRRFRITYPAVVENGQLKKGIRWKFDAYVASATSSMKTSERIPFAFTLRITGEVTEEVLNA